MSFNQPLKLRKYVFRSPKTFTSILFLVPIIVLIYLSSHSLRLTVIYALTISIAISFDYSIQKVMGFVFNLKRILLLFIISLYASLVYYFILVGLRFLPPTTAFMLSLTPITFLRAMIYLTFTERKRILAHGISMSFPIITSIFFFIFLPQFNVFILAFLISSLIYSIAGDIFISRSFSPFIKEFSTDPSILITSLLNASYLGKSYNEILKDFFSTIYKTTSSRPISVLRFKDHKEFYFVFPYVHPGPLGDIGSSNITGKFSKYQPDKQMAIFHTSTTHDDNCSDEDEIKKLSQIFNEEGWVSYEYCYRPYFGENSVFLPIGDGGILFIIPDKVRFDDILYEEGNKLIAYAKHHGLKWLEVVDAHNNIMDKPVELMDTSFLYGELKNAIEQRDGIYPIYGDYSSIDYTSQDIGPGGIKLIKLKLGENIVGIILFDGNNMDYQFRNELESRLVGVDKTIICTTDNHIVNINGLSVNPVGRNYSHDQLIEKIVEEFDRLNPNNRLSVDYIRREYRLKVAGESQYEKLNATIKRSLNSAKLYVILMLLFSIVFSLFIFKYLS